MDIFCDSNEMTARFEQYVVDLRRLFVFHSIPCGSAEGFVALGMKLEESKAFRLDLPALVRTIHALAGDRMSAEEMLTILALASGGADLVDGRAETVGLMRTVTLLRVLVAAAGAWSERSALPGRDEEPGAAADATLAGAGDLAALTTSRTALETSLEQLRRQVSEMERRVHRLEPLAVADVGPKFPVGGDADETATPAIAGFSGDAFSAPAGANGGASAVAVPAELLGNASAGEGVVSERAREVTRVREVEPGYAEAFDPKKGSGARAVVESAPAREAPVRVFSSRWALLGGLAAMLLVLIGFGVMRLVSSIRARTILARAGAKAEPPSLARVEATPAVGAGVGTAIAANPPGEAVGSAAPIAPVAGPAKQPVAAATTGHPTPAAAEKASLPAAGTSSAAAEKASLPAARSSSALAGTAAAAERATLPVPVKTPALAGNASVPVAEKATLQDAIGAPGIVPVGPAVMERNLVSSRKPVFPASALARGEEGTVVLNTFIAKDGSVSRMDLLSGAPPFIDSAMAAVSWRRYRPYLLRGRPVAVVTPVTVTYRRP